MVSINSPDILETLLISPSQWGSFLTAYIMGTSWPWKMIEMSVKPQTSQGGGIQALWPPAPRVITLSFWECGPGLSHVWGACRAATACCLEAVQAPLALWTFSSFSWGQWWGHILKWGIIIFKSKRRKSMSRGTFESARRSNLFSNLVDGLFHLLSSWSLFPAL